MTRGLSWKRLAVTLSLIPLVGLWAYSIVRSAGHVLTLLDSPATVPVPTVVTTSDQAIGAARPTGPVVVDAARAPAVPDADEVPVEAQIPDSADARAHPSAADILPLFEEYLIEADEEQARQIAQTVEEFLPAER
jgi:hypothetical protein